VAQIGEQLHSGHERARETELLRDVVVVDLVRGVRREVASPDPVRRRRRKRRRGLAQRGLSKSIVE
jgi:uncharacterized membrane-anchored protein